MFFTVQDGRHSRLTVARKEGREGYYTRSFTRRLCGENHIRVVAGVISAREASGLIRKIYILFLKGAICTDTNE